MIPGGCFGDAAELINHHLEHHAGIELRDIYKLLHQSVFGPEHLGEGVGEEAIEREMRGHAVEFEEPLFEPISVDGLACRVNLRTAARLGIAPSRIAGAVESSADMFRRDRCEMERLWRWVGESPDRLTKKFGADDFNKLTAFAEEKGFPPLHHSSSYRELNRPAYRVLMRPELKRLMRDSPASDLSP